MRTAGTIVAVGWVLCLGVGVVSAGQEPDMPTPPASSAQLNQLKKLAGRWEGTSQHEGGAGEPAAAEYRVTSGGSAVMETLFPGTPHEMVSVYHDSRTGKPAMTHYCMLGNQPELELAGSGEGILDFNLSTASDIPASELHMHALKLSWDGPDQLTQVWTSYKDGQPQGSTTIRLKRVN